MSKLSPVLSSEVDWGRITSQIRYDVSELHTCQVRVQKNGRIRYQSQMGCTKYTSANILGFMENYVKLRLFKREINFHF
jgi:hypothetical protein